MRRGLFRAALIVAMLPLAGAPAAAADAWKWSLTPYLWLTDLGVDASVHDQQIVNTTVDIKDLAKDLDLILQVHTEGQHGANGLLLDLFYVKLTDDPKTFVPAAAPGVTAVFNTEIKLTIFELGGIFDPKGDQEGFQLLYGARVIDQNADIGVQVTGGPGGPSAQTFEPGDTTYDGLLGGRWVKRFGRGWNTALRADASAGGTQLTWNASAVLAYAWGKDGRYAFTFGYRYMDIDFKEKDSVDSEMTLAGPAIGFRFLF